LTPALVINTWVTGNDLPAKTQYIHIIKHKHMMNQDSDLLKIPHVASTVGEKQ